MSKNQYTDPKVKNAIALRIIAAFFLLIVTLPLAFLYVAVTGKRSPFVDLFLDWAIDGPITSYEKKHGLS